MAEPPVPAVRDDDEGALLPFMCRKLDETILEMYIVRRACGRVTADGIGLRRAHTLWLLFARRRLRAVAQVRWRLYEH